MSPIYINSIRRQEMTYAEFISQFEEFDNPPQKEGYHRHHIVPECEQVKFHGSVTDQRQVYLTPLQHMWAHLLYDREHDTTTSTWFLNLCGKSADYFDCWEKCLNYSSALNKKIEVRNAKIAEVCRTDEFRQKMSESRKDIVFTEEHKRNISKSKKGTNHPNYGKHRKDDTKTKISNTLKGHISFNRGMHFFNNGIKNVMAYECPEGFVPGRLKKVTV